MSDVSLSEVKVLFRFSSLVHLVFLCTFDCRGFLAPILHCLVFAQVQRLQTHLVEAELQIAATRP